MNVIIVGCGNIGFETAKLLHQEHQLLLIDISQQQHISDFLRTHDNVMFLPADATDATQMERAIGAFVDRYHRVDALVSTVGAFSNHGPIDNFEGFKRNLELNFFGNLVPLKCVIGPMIAAKSGRLIVISSTSGHHVPRDLTAYSPAKWALESLSNSLRSELMPHGITVDVISPASLKNKYSTTFVKTRNTIEAPQVASTIKRVLLRPGNSNHFVPAPVRMYHPVERIAPRVLDRMYGLKPRRERVRRLRNAVVESAMIVGAASDVGKRLAHMNAKTVKKLYLVDGDRDALLDVKGQIAAVSGCDVDVAALSLSDRKSVKAYVDSISGVDLLINVSGASTIGAVADIPVDLYKRNFDEQFFGVVYILAELFKKESKPKKIINVLPSIVIAGKGYHSSYACSATAFWSYTRALRRVYGNELQVMEAISPHRKSAVHAVEAVGANDHNPGDSIVDHTAQKIYGAEKKGMEIVTVLTRDKLVLLTEGLTPGLFNKVYARASRNS